MAIERLMQISSDPLSKVQLNQILVMGHEAPVSDGFFQYYWLTKPEGHPYPVDTIPGFDRHWLVEANEIISLDHLWWGIYRIYIDGLLFFGNVRTAFRKLRALTFDELLLFFHKYHFDTTGIKRRGPPLPLQNIAKDDRYLIAEVACKSYGEYPEQKSELHEALVEALKSHLSAGGGRVSIRNLLAESFRTKNQDRQYEFNFSADDVLEEQVSSTEELNEKFDRVAQQFKTARDIALKNTELYLSMVSELDVYVATSMREREHFRKMADVCTSIFGDERLKQLSLRFFDPTLSAAKGHEDKGLIECLMVKCARALVYWAGKSDSFGKDAECAMALSLGKPVIILCDQEQKVRFFRDVHPLSRLIDFNTGVAVGAMVTDNTAVVAELLRRIFENKMEYDLVRSKSESLQLKERMTGSVVRLQTSDRMLAETFWNHYHNRGIAET